MTVTSIMRAAALVVALIICVPATAREWPQQPVWIVVPYVAGGAVDIMARVLADARP